NRTANLQIDGGTFTLSQVNDSSAGAGAGIGTLQSSSGKVTVTGPFGKFIALKDLGIGVNGAGTLIVQNGASAWLGDGKTLGRLSNGNGSITVTGNGSTLMMGKAVGIGLIGSGSLDVGDGGSVTIGEDLLVGAGSGGVINVNNAGTLNLAGTALLGEG